MPSLQTWVYILAISLIVMLCVIGYQKLLKKLNKNRLTHENYCVLHSLETENAHGVVDFYFTSQEARTVTFEILDENYQTLHILFDEECVSGGNIIPFDSSTVANGSYFYCLKTYNQKTMKKMRVKN